jgi:hypothetical protein
MGTSFGVFDSLAQYGILGIFTLALGAALWFLLKRQLESEDQLKKKVDALQQEINNYIRNDQSKILDIMENHNRILQELRDVILMNGYKSKNNT